MHIIIACILNCCSLLTFKHAQMVLIYKNKIKISLLYDLLNLLLLSSQISEKSPHTWCSHSTSVLRVIWLLTPSHQQIALPRSALTSQWLSPMGVFSPYLLPLSIIHHCWYRHSFPFPLHFYNSTFSCFSLDFLVTPSSSSLQLPPPQPGHWVSEFSTLHSSTSSSSALCFFSRPVILKHVYL